MCCCEMSFASILPHIHAVLSTHTHTDTPTHTHTHTHTSTHTHTRTAGIDSYKLLPNKVGYCSSNIFYFPYGRAAEQSGLRLKRNSNTHSNRTPPRPHT